LEEDSVKDYTAWVEKQVAVTSLQLDPENPRIPPTESPLAQAQILTELVKHDNIVPLAEDIVQQGYYPLESLIGLEGDDGKTYILEGNRRLAALKLIINPQLAPQDAQKKIKTIAANATLGLIKKVRVLYAPTREAAAPLIMQKHTRSQVEKWAPLMQARFYNSLLKEGVEISEIAKQYGVAASEILEELKLLSLYTLATKIPLSDATRHKIHDPRAFPASTIRRIFETPSARKRLGVEFDKRGGVVGKISKDSFIKAYTRILIDAASDAVNTRTLNKAEDIDKYLDGLGKDAPDPSATGSFVGEDLNTSPAQPKEKGAKSTPKDPAPKAGNTSKTSAYLIPRNFACSIKSNRVRDVFHELRKLKVDDFPNTCGILLRVLVELSLGYYMEKTGLITPLLEKAKKDKKADSWYPTLNQLLNELNKEPDLPLSPLAKKRLNKMLSDKDSFINVELLDSYVHNRFAFPKAKELRSIWETFEGILTLTLQEPPPSPKA
jgi:hypothetical protein